MSRWWWGGYTTLCGGDAYFCPLLISSPSFWQHDQAQPGVLLVPQSTPSCHRAHHRRLRTVEKPCHAPTSALATCTGPRWPLSRSLCISARTTARAETGLNDHLRYLKQSASICTNQALSFCPRNVHELATLPAFVLSFVNEQ